jgi:hypothetical protein
METSGVIGEVRRVTAVRAADAADRADLEDALRSVGRLEAWLAGTKAAITSRLAERVSFPEQTIAECTRGSTRDAIKDKERADTLGSTPGLAGALDDARVTAGHVDEVTKAIKGLEGEQRQELFDRVDHDLLDVAAAATVEEFRRRLALEVKHIQRDDGVDRFERQRRASRLRTWTDGEGMFCLSGRFDPVTGVKLSAKLDAAVNALFAEATPDTCPSDPVEKQRHLAALALASLLDGAAGGGRPGRPEFVVVVDTSQPDGGGGPLVDWGIPVEVPHRVLAELMDDGGSVQTVVVRNGVVIHAPGELDLGRSTRLASRAQRRALRGLYSSCAIPGCSVRYERCKLHHVEWWRHGGRTDLHNLLPICVHHHTKIHDHGWVIELGARRELTIRFPDGTIRTTGPPTRRAA